MQVSATRIVPAVEADVPLILELIKGLAEYERLSDSVIATEGRLRESLFGAKPAAEVLLAYQESECAGFAIFYPVYSTFLAQAGIYLEDLFVRPQLRGRGIGLALLARVARIAIERNCARVEWGVLYDRAESCRVRYWGLPKDARIETGLRPDVSTFGYSGALIVDLVSDLLAKALRGNYPFTIDSMQCFAVFGEEREFTRPTEILAVVEPALVDLEARLTASEVTLKSK